MPFITGMKGCKLLADIITLAHGGGGDATGELIREIEQCLGGPNKKRHDAAVFYTEEASLAFTSDSFVVRPPFFPGGDIGCLAVYGTANDLAMAAAVPRYMSLSLIIEEGLARSIFRRIIESVARAAEHCRVRILTGDIKVVGRGQADKIYINTSGVGSVIRGSRVCPTLVEPGDLVIASGDLGAHGAAILAEREGINNGQLESDTSPVFPLVQALLNEVPRVKVLRDPTRGGVAAVLTEIARQSGVRFVLFEKALPVERAVRSFCSLLGLDPLFLASEGRFLAVVEERDADNALAVLRSYPEGEKAAVIGEAREAFGVLFPEVTVETMYGGERLLPPGAWETLPRIC